jgi:hypothetical protein
MVFLLDVLSLAAVAALALIQKSQLIFSFGRLPGRDAKFFAQLHEPDAAVAVQ